MKPYHRQMSPEAGDKIGGMPLIRLMLLAIFAFASLSGEQAWAQEKLTVFAAASLKEALENAAAAYTEESGTAIVFSFAGTSAIARQLEAGAPADLFFSADQRWMDHVRDAGAVDPVSITVVATNTLVFVAPKSNPEELELTAADIERRLGDGRLAIAEPETVPAGRYAKAALDSLSLWASVRDRLAPMENVRIALAAVARGEAPMGIVYASDAVAEKDVAVIAKVPTSSHPAIVYPAAITTTAKPAARDFLCFLKSPKGRQAFAAAGLDVAD